jgi:predicted alpha/beta superfamily hydrolase
MKGQIITDHFMDRELIIYLPPSYKKAEKGFAVVYVQDKDYLFQSNSLIALEVLFEESKLAELVLVGVETKDRFLEYTPWHGKALDDRHDDFGGGGADYLSFLAQKLKPYIDRKYNTLTDLENTGIVGASLGGLIALYAAYLYPGIFGRIGSISGSFWYEGLMEFMETQQLDRIGQKIYMDVGSLEGADRTNVLKNMVSRTKNAYQTLCNKGFADENCKLVVEQDGIHHPSFFTRRFPNALGWLFAK